MSPEKVENLRDTIYVRVPNNIYKQVYAVSKNSEFSMSEVVRQCIEYSLPAVESRLYKIRRERMNEASNKGNKAGGG